MSDTIKGFLINGEIFHYDYNALDNVPDNGAGIFWATYGTTTSNEIEEAIANNKTVALNYENNIYYLSSILDKIAPNNVYLFRSEDNVANYQIMMSGSNWQSVRVLNWIQPSNDGPLPLLEDGVSSPGISERYSRGDHQHPMPEMNLGIDQTDGLLYFYINNNKHGNGIPISGSSGSGLTEAVKLALLQLASKVPYIDEHGEDYYQDLYDALYSNFYNVTYILEGCSSSNTDTVVKEGSAYSSTINVSHAYSLSGATISIKMGGTDVTGLYSNGSINIPNVTGNLVIIVRAVPSGVTVSSISATYTQSGTVYTTDSLDDLKQDLVVTATWSDSTTDVVPSSDYTLSGTLTAGTSTITVNYFEQSDTFNVTVTKYSYSGIVDGTYTDHFGNPKLTMENNTVKDIINVSTYTNVENIRLTREIVLHAGDVIRFTAYCPNWSSSNPSRYHNIVLPNSGISQIALQDVYRNAETTATATVPSDYTFTVFTMSVSYNWEGVAFRLSFSVNGEEMF